MSVDILLHPFQSADCAACDGNEGEEEKNFPPDISQFAKNIAFHEYD